MPAVDSLPPTTELYTKSQLVQRHPHLLSDHRVAWALRKRKANGLSNAGAVFDSPCGELLIHEPAFFVVATWPRWSRQAARTPQAPSRSGVIPMRCLPDECTALKVTP
jgi:hypothetical protein